MSLPHGDTSSNKTPGLHRSNFVPTHISPVSGPRLVMPLRAMSAQRVLLALLSSLLAARCDLPTPGASDFDVSGHQNRVQRIELKASLAIPDGGEMQLPILVDPAPIAVWGDGPPKIVSVSSPHADGTFGVGERIDVEVRFTSPVVVLGDPSQLALTMRTGCHAAACATREVQTIVCYADYGKWALSWMNETVSNIDALADPEHVKYAIERFSAVRNVTVEFGDDDDRQYSEGRRACTSRGNTITVTFDDVEAREPRATRSEIAPRKRDSRESARAREAAPLAAID